MVYKLLRRVVTPHIQILRQPWVSSVPPAARPRAEALSDLVARTIPFWRDHVEQSMKEG